MTNEIRVEQLSLNYGDRKALDRVSFTVPDNCVFGLLGPNGGGKTTLFRILCTLLQPTSGSAYLAGVSVTQDPTAVRRSIGVVFQTNSLDHELTVLENLSYQARLQGLARAEIRLRIEEALARFGLADRARDLVKSLSGGLQRRLELAKALLHRPRILILDEPTAALDPTARFDVWNYLKLLRDQQSTTILLTTHLMEEAGRCDRLAILNHGRIVSEGTPEALKERIGGDVITIKSEQAGELRGRLEQHFQCRVQEVDGALLIERPRGHEFVAKVIEAFPGQISAITVSRPTLEDVFVHETGHRFETESIDGSG